MNMNVYMYSTFYLSAVSRYACYCTELNLSIAIIYNMILLFKIPHADTEGKIKTDENDFITSLLVHPNCHNIAVKCLNWVTNR